MSIDPILRSTLETCRLRYFIELDRRPAVSYADRGFIVDFSDSLILLHNFCPDCFRLNGYTAIRTADVRNYRVFGERSAYPFKAIQHNKVKPEPTPEISLVTLPDLLTSVCNAYPLVTIHRELIFPDECFIGRLAAMTPKTFTLYLLNPEAKWVGTMRFRFSDVTRVDFGGGYEASLMLCASESPKIRR